MSDWSKTIAEQEKKTFKITTPDDCGTGFLLHKARRQFIIASAWHVIEGLLAIEDKWSRNVLIESSDITFEIKANIVGIVRLGVPEIDVGLFWIGPPFNQEEIDATLRALTSLAKAGEMNGDTSIFGWRGHRRNERRPSVFLTSGLAKNTTPT